ncbi:Glucose dehydrogenase [FAD, quinone] [Cryptotermes secundus]|uniref:Glucose dehydrogenase [FAD, quinone] n=1 Tax=Cryptotermes secundus TaxID=105785 RepID=A0A2J7RBG0_9NEOP|nr:glucose dehydrogenase [FAD, quinone] [Cryptotermes secundus]PNF38173.1 Glucose dehydrogenase [FAD, quinone] [Cryptotermes secundus]
MSLVAIVSGATKLAVSIIGLGTKLWFLPTFLAAFAYYHYDLFDPENRPINVKEVLPKYDFVIIGGGTAGAVLANRLTEVQNFNVLLLEAGGDEPEIADVPILSIYLHRSQIDWKYRTQPQASACQAMVDKRCCWTRGKVLGGSSVLNTMLYIRGNRRDFDLWESLGNPGWGYDEVLPYFKKSEDQRNPYLANNTKYHGTGGYLTVQDAPWNTPLGIALVQAGVEMGYEHRDINGEKQTGFALFQYNMRRGYRCSSAKAFLRPVRLRKNIHIAMWSHVTKVLIDPNTKRAFGVEFIRGGKKQVVLASREVILSAGAIGTPHLLMLSGVGPAEHLRQKKIPVIHDAPGVGQNLQDHIAIGGIAFQIDYPVSVLIDRFMNLNNALRYAVQGDGPLTSNIGLETVGFISTKYANQTDDWPDIEFMMTATTTSSDGGTQTRKAHCITQKFYDEYFAPINKRDTFGIFPMILRPKSRGYIKLRTNDPMDYPLIYHNYLTHPDDVRVMREGVKAAIAVGETASMKRFGTRFYRKVVPGCNGYEFFTDEYWECVIRQYTMTIYHMSGTAKMGPADDPFAVVDHELKVHGIQGLRVIDASIMPTITSGNINAPVYMIAEKGADIIKELWKSTKKERKRRGVISNNSTNIKKRHGSKARKNSQ